jgi:hypothetical protein
VLKRESLIELETLTELLEKVSINHDVGLIADGGKKDHHAVGALHFPLEDANEGFQEAIFDHDLIACVELFPNHDKPIRLDSRLHEGDDGIIYRRGFPTETHDTVNAPCVTDFMKEAGRIKPSEDVPGE